MHLSSRCNLSNDLTLSSELFPGDEYILKMRILDHVFDDVTIDELKLTVILPEGVRNIAFE